MWCWRFLFFLAFSEPTFGSHFDGGAIRWAPVNKNVTTSPVQIMITQTYTYTLSSVTCTVGSLMGTNIYGFNFSLWCTYNCGATSAGYVAPPILGYCTGSSPGLNIAFAQRTDIVNLTANDYFSISYAIPNTATLGYYRPLALSTGGNDTTSQWNITASIDIRPRADNGLINTPPMANVISPYGIPYNITTQIVIPTMDVDGDDVRCRWGNSSLECGDVCFPRTIPASTLLSSNCILTITGTSTYGWYCAAIQVEDFLNSSSSQPMSSTAVQFLIYVYKPKNCSIPALSSPSTCVGVRVGIPSIVTLTVINSCGSSSSISDIAIQSISGIVKGTLIQVTPNKTVYTMNVTYTPLASQVGLQIICATALDNTNIPSNQYCVTFIVGTTVTPTCPGVTSTTFQTSTLIIITTESITTNSETNASVILTTNVDTTSIAPVTSSSSAMVISTENLQTSETSPIVTNIQIVITSSDTTRLITSSSITSTSKPNAINWPLIGSLIGVISLLILLGSCCFCYHYLWSAAARRRRRQRQEDKQTLRYQPVNDPVTGSNKISRPSKAYQIYDIITNRRKSSNNTKTCRRTKPYSSVISNIIRPQTREKSIANNSIPISSSTIKDDPPVNVIELKEDLNSITNNTDNKNENRIKSTVSITRIRKSIPNESTIKRSSPAKIFVTRIKKNVQ